MSVPGWLISKLLAIPGVQVVPEDENTVRFAMGEGPQVRLALAMAGELSSIAVQRMVADSPQARMSDFLLGNTYPRPLLVLARLTEDGRTQLTQARRSWVERDTGIVHIDAPPYYVHTATPIEPKPKGRRRDDTPPANSRPTKLVGLSGRCAESILLWHETQPDSAGLITTQILSEIADVAWGLATRVLHRLEQAEALTPQRHGRRTFGWAISRPDRILDLWADEDTKRPRHTAAYVWAASPRTLLAQLSKIETATPSWAVGGVAAANLYAPTLTADPIPTVWIPDATPAADVINSLGGKQVTEGANLILQQAPNDPWVVNRVDGRNPAASPDRPSHRKQSSAEATEWHQALRLHNMGRHLPPVALVSRPRAYVEALQEKRGRSAEVAEAVRHTLPFERTAR